MDYNSASGSTCPIGFHVFPPKKSEEDGDDRVQVDIGFFFKGKERGEERSFYKFDDYATIFLDREEIENHLPEAANLDNLLIGKHLRVEELDRQSPYAHIPGRVSPVANERDGRKNQLEDQIKQAYSDSAKGNRREKCQEVVSKLLRAGEANDRLKEFVKYDTIQALLK